jgi:hypothetical protein
MNERQSEYMMSHKGKIYAVFTAAAHGVKKYGVI